jgi:hypothetical protein
MTYDNPEEFITQMFKELRQLCADGHRKQIDDEIIYMTGAYLHNTDGSDCLLRAKDADAVVFDANADVISEHLTINGAEITDLAAEAIVRRLANSNVGFRELAEFNSWLGIFGFQPLTKIEE